MELSATEVAEVAELVLGPDAGPGAWHVEPIAYQSGSPATGGLARVRGDSEGRTWSVFVKLVQNPRHWPLLHLVPEVFRDELCRTLPWRQELAMWEEPFAAHLPDGLRVPVLYRITELDTERLLLWMEDVDAIADRDWTLDHYRRAAVALGGLAARRSTPDILAAAGEPGWALRLLVGSRVMRGAAPALEDDRLWAHPLVVSAVDAELRDDLRRIAEAVPAILDRLDTLPQTLAHGDASPQNLLVPRGEPDTFVAIDVAFQCPLAIGFDLGQLLVGLAHAGHVEAAALPAIHDILVPAYVEGMRAYGVDPDPDAVTCGYVGGLVARAALTSLPYETLDSPHTEQLATLWQQRAALTRFIADLGFDLVRSTAIPPRSCPLPVMQA
ncbi:aminoglycoside phosphotransferase [Catellatospora vulcania]|uniref:aminoglycoside phosphotransferase n=1 Tax=Catellatospora vulcania TaxID=1460450 RepID=UPI0012D49273|nr:aminoglycoside phosphotransferase [Catellatospora vulcania]